MTVLLYVFELNTHMILNFENWVPEMELLYGRIKITAMFNKHTSTPYSPIYLGLNVFVTSDIWGY